MDDFQNYSGHCIVLPLSHEAYNKMKAREMKDTEITTSDLVNYKTQEQSIFFNYDITADCNDNVFYLAHQYLNFFKNIENKNYEFCSHTMRYDSYEINQQLGLELLWEDSVQKDSLGQEFNPRFYTGNFNSYFSKE